MAKRTTEPASVSTDLLVVSETAKRLNVPEGTLGAWRSTGKVKLPYVKLGGLIRYRRSDVEEFIAASLRNGG